MNDAETKLKRISKLLQKLEVEISDIRRLLRGEKKNG